MMTRTRAEYIAHIREGQQQWREVVAEVGPDRMQESGPMGEWSFRDLAGHLLGWRNRTIGRLEAAARGEAMPPPPWPAEMEDDDTINAWFHEQDRARSSEELLAEYDASFDRLAAAVEALPAGIFEDPNALPWLEGTALSDTDPLSHFKDEHEASVRAWLAG